MIMIVIIPKRGESILTHKYKVLLLFLLLLIPYALSADVIKQLQILNLARLYVVNVARLFQTRLKKYYLNGGILRHQMGLMIKAE
jgi:hypothetical protein